MEGSSPTPYFFVKEISLNIIIALRRLFIIFLLYFKCFYYSKFLCVFVFFCCCILSIFVLSFFHLSHIIHFIIRLYNMYIYNTKEFSASSQFATNDLVLFVC